MTIHRLRALVDYVGGGAWPVLIGGVTCLVNYVHERDPRLLNSVVPHCVHRYQYSFLRGTSGD